jgi:hypothetical protein
VAWTANRNKPWRFDAMVLSGFELSRIRSRGMFEDRFLRSTFSRRVLMPQADAFPAAAKCRRRSASVGVAAVRDALHRSAFQPFTIRLADGRALPVPHPDFVAIAPRRRRGGRQFQVNHRAAANRVTRFDRVKIRQPLDQEDAPGFLIHLPNGVQGFFEGMADASALLFAAPISHTTRKPESGRRNESIPQ